MQSIKKGSVFKIYLRKSGAVLLLRLWCLSVEVSEFVKYNHKRNWRGSYFNAIIIHFNWITFNQAYKALEIGIQFKTAGTTERFQTKIDADLIFFFEWIVESVLITLPIQTIVQWNWVTGSALGIVRERTMPLLNWLLNCQRMTGKWSTRVLGTLNINENKPMVKGKVHCW